MGWQAERINMRRNLGENYWVKRKIKQGEEDIGGGLSATQLTSQSWSKRESQI